MTNSVVVFAVRKGNPKNIKTWDDLIKDGVEVITPNPFTSGGAKWNIMAAYGAQLEQGKSEDQAKDYLTSSSTTSRCWTRAPARRCRRSSGGKGDVLHLLRERGDHRPAEGRGRRLRHPRRDDPDPEPGRRDHGCAGDQGTGVPRLPRTATRRRRSIADEGLPLREPGPGGRQPSSPTPPKLFEITKFGGWDKVNDEFFDPEGGDRRRHRAGPGSLRPAK